MTARAAHGLAGLISGRTAAVRRLDDIREVRSLLNEERAYSAYALAYLDPSLFRLADFYEAQAGEKRALLMHAHGGLGPSTLALGDAAVVGALLKLHPGPRQTFLTCKPDQTETLLVTRDLWRPQTMLRMQLERDAFAPPADKGVARRLIDADAPDLNRLYAIEGDGLHYSGRQISSGVYYGVHVRGRLVAAAGTHIYSAAEGVGVIGNVFTHPDHRARGYGTAVTAAVAAQLLQRCELVVLNVDPANRTARHIYENLGFHDTGRLIEAMATRRDNYSPLPLLRRAIARRRSQVRGIELVDL